MQELLRTGIYFCKLEVNLPIHPWEGENRNTILTSLTGNAATGDITFTANDDKTELATNVVNNKGSELPSTGGMGTTIFYVVGSILVLGAAILLITKKRMSAR